MQATYKVLNVLETIETDEINVTFNPMPTDSYFNCFQCIQEIDDINL